MRGIGSARLARLGMLALLVGAASWAVATGAASALTVTAPPDVPRSATVTVTVAGADPAGTLTLTVDGSVVATAAAGPGDAVAFPAVALRVGARSLAATITDGQTTAESRPLKIMSWGVPAQPELVRPTGDYVAGAADVFARAGAWTTSLTVLVNWSPIGTMPCLPGQTVFFGILGSPPGYHVYAVIAENPCGERVATVRHFTRIEYPASTSIVVDKSDFRLYWIANDRLIRTYRVAIGKSGTPTPSALWIVGLKEYMPPAGVYGPRRLKLARLVRGGYRMTGYGIHGTNEPWVIGTMASHGCIRLTNDMILDLWPQVPLGTVVQTRQ